MPSIFAGLQQQLNALPQATPAPARRRGLFGGRGPTGGDLAAFAMNGLYGVHNARQRDRASELATMERARLESFANTIQDPRERQVFQIAPDEWAKNTGMRLRPETLSQGSIQVINGQPVAAAPVIDRYDDRPGITNPLTGQTAFGEPRGMTEAERTARMNAENYTLSPGQARFGPQGQVASVADTATLSPGQQFFQGGQVVAQNNLPRPISDADQAAITRSEATIAALDNAIGRASTIKQQIATGKLNLGPMTNMISGGLNMVGRSNDNSRRYADLQQWAKQARDALLQANTGVQTDQDAIRALENIMARSNDERLVQQYLDQFITAQTATRNVYQRDIARRAGGQSQGQAAPQGQGNVSREAAIAELRRRGLIQ